MDHGNIPTPIFNRKRPRQAILAHPNNSQSTGLHQNNPNVHQISSTGQGMGKTQGPLNVRGYQTQGQGFRGMNANAPTTTLRARPAFGHQHPIVRPTVARQSMPSTSAIRQGPTATMTGWHKAGGQTTNNPGIRAPMQQPTGQLPYCSPAKGTQPWGNPATPSTSGGYNAHMNMNTDISYFEEEFNQHTFTDTTYPTSYQPTKQSPYPPPRSQETRPPPAKTSQPGKSTSDKFKIKTKIVNSEQSSLRLLTATVKRVKEWMKHREKVALLFEVLGTIQVRNPATLKQSSDIQFLLRDETGAMPAVFYEIDRSFPNIIKDHTYRLVGRATQNHMKFQCISIRPANTAELQLHLSAVNASDASMREWASMNEQ